MQALFDNEVEMINFENIKAVIFDMDGTLVSSMHLWQRLLPDFLKNHGLVASSEMLARVNYMSFDQSSPYVVSEFPQLKMTPEEVRAEWMEMIYEDYSERVLLKPGAKEFMLKLREKGIKIAIATACVKKLAEACLENNGVSELIDVITYAEDVGCGKDNPKIYEMCLKELGCRADEAILFEDILVPIQTAARIGLRAVAVEDEAAASERKEIKKAANMYIRDFRELKSL